MADDPLDVPAGERRQFRHPIGETYLGEPVSVPVSVLSGAEPGPRVLLMAALHGDELNGVKVLQQVAARYDPAELHGTLVLVHVGNVPGFLAQERYLPIYDLDLNRSFPGRAGANTAERMADALYRTFVSPCDLGLDFHTSTRNRTTMFHLRADLAEPSVARLAEAFGANVVLSGPGDEGSLRRVATGDGIPTVTIEMGKAHRFQPGLIDQALRGVESVLAAYDVLPDGEVVEPAWRKVMEPDEERRWLRADVGGLVDMQWGPEPLVHAGDPICTLTDHFSQRESVVEAPFTGLIVGVLENPVAQPGHPLCHLVRISPETREEIEREIQRGEFDGYRSYGQRWMADEELAE